MNKTSHKPNTRRRSFIINRLRFFSELAREKIWSRLHILPLLQAEEDRDQARRHFADKARERELLGQETKVYNTDKYVILKGNLGLGTSNANGSVMQIRSPYIRLYPLQGHSVNVMELKLLLLLLRAWAVHGVSFPRSSTTAALDWCISGV